MCPTTWFWGFSVMLVGYMRVSSTDDRQSVDLQRDALTAAGVDQRHLYSDKASGARDDRAGLKACLLHERRRHAGCLEARSARPLAAAPAGDRHRPQGTRHRLPVADRTDGYHHAAWRVAVLAVRRARPIRASVDAGADHGGPGRRKAAGPT